jgi:hypothetical protein
MSHSKVSAYEVLGVMFRHCKILLYQISARLCPKPPGPRLKLRNACQSNNSGFSSLGSGKMSRPDELMESKFYAMAMDG